MFDGQAQEPQTPTRVASHEIPDGSNSYLKSVVNKIQTWVSEMLPSSATEWLSSTREQHQRQQQQRSYDLDDGVDAEGLRYEEVVLVEHDADEDEELHDSQPLIESSTPQLPTPRHPPLSSTPNSRSHLAIGCGIAHPCHFFEKPATNHQQNATPAHLLKSGVKRKNHNRFINAKRGSFMAAGAGVSQSGSLDMLHNNGGGRSVVSLSRRKNSALRENRLLTSSPFYPGPTAFGGFSANNRTIFDSTTTLSSAKFCSCGIVKPVEMRPEPTPEHNPALSTTARYILNSLTLPERDLDTPTASKKLMSTELLVPTMQELLQRRRLQRVTMEANETLLDKRMPSLSVELSTLPSSARHNNKMQTRLSQHSTRKKVDHEPPLCSDLSNMTLPPKLDMDIPLISKKNTKMDNTNGKHKFTFSAPLPLVPISIRNPLPLPTKEPPVAAVVAKPPSPDISKVQPKPSPPPLITPLANNRPANSWECEVCMILNKSSAAKCVACEAPNPKAVASISDTPRPKPDAGFQQLVAQQNDFSRSSSICCELPKPDAFPFRFGAAPASEATKVTLGFKFGAPTAELEKQSKSTDSNSLISGLSKTSDAVDIDK